MGIPIMGKSLLEWSVTSLNGIRSKAKCGRYTVAIVSTKTTRRLKYRVAGSVVNITYTIDTEISTAYDIGAVLQERMIALRLVLTLFECSRRSKRKENGEGNEGGFERELHYREKGCIWLRKGWRKTGPLSLGCRKAGLYASPWMTPVCYRGKDSTARLTGKESPENATQGAILQNGESNVVAFNGNNLAPGRRCDIEIVVQKLADYT